MNMFITESIMFLMDSTSVLSHYKHNNYVYNGKYKLFSIKNMASYVHASLLI